MGLEEWQEDGIKYTLDAFSPVFCTGALCIGNEFGTQDVDGLVYGYIGLWEFDEIEKVRVRQGAVSGSAEQITHVVSVPDGPHEDLDGEGIGVQKWQSTCNSFVGQGYLKRGVEGVDFDFEHVRSETFEQRGIKSP